MARLEIGPLHGAESRWEECLWVLDCSQCGTPQLAAAVNTRTGAVFCTSTPLLLM